LEELFAECFAGGNGCTLNIEIDVSLYKIMYKLSISQWVFNLILQIGIWELWDSLI